MSTEISTFEFHGSTVRATADGNEVWFCGRDICEQLEYKDSVNALKQHCRGVVKRHPIVDALGRTQESVFISEPDVWRLICSSKQPKAIELERWIFDEVLPSIRRHGGYLTPEKVEEALTDPDTIIRLATNLKEERAKRKELEALREAERPKVLFADSVSASETDILVGDLAKILKQNGIDIGQNRLFEFLRREGYLCRKQGDMWNMPTQTAMNIGLFKIMETTFIRNGKTFVTKTVKVTGRGQVYFVNLFLRRAKEEAEKAEKAAAAQLQLAQN